MSPETFESSVARTQMRGDTIEAARLVLVYGTTMAQAAERYGRSHSWARQAVARVRRASRYVLLCPDGWEVVTACLPPEDAEAVREMERRRREDLAS